MKINRMECDIVYIRLLVDEACANAGADWKTNALLADTTLEGTETGLALTKNNADVLTFSRDGLIKMNYGGHMADRNGFSIYQPWTTEYTKQDDSSYTDGNGNTVAIKATTDDGGSGICTDQNGKIMQWEKIGEDDTKINVWTSAVANFIIRNILQLDVTYSEMVNVYENEQGKTILYPIRRGKRSLEIKLETDLGGLKRLISYFQQPEFWLFYRSPADLYDRGGVFRKTSDIQVESIKKNGKYNNYPIYLDNQNEEIGAVLYYDLALDTLLDAKTGIYNFSVNLEEV